MDSNGGEETNAEEKGVKRVPLGKLPALKEKVIVKVLRKLRFKGKSMGGR